MELLTHRLGGPSDAHSSSHVLTEHYLAVPP
jgi:hypothetical protein